jgi:hypothetical protein
VNKQLHATQRRIERITQRLERDLGLDRMFDVGHHFVEGFDGDTDAPGPDGSLLVAKTQACTTATWQYRECKITWYLGSCLRKTDEELEATAVHEYCHALTAPLAGMVPGDVPSPLMSSAQQQMIESAANVRHLIEEFTTENLARVILAAYGR